ncbi:MAG: YlbF family regulator [Bacteroides sp.]|nr:YlbF family regulator [Bacteroides sp.]
MDVIKAARELGRAIQNDERYKGYIEAKNENDKDEALQQLIGEFNLKRENLQLEMNKSEDSRDEEKTERLNKELQNCYEKVMGNAHMANFAVMKNALDNLLQEVQGIISLCCDGEDPDTCQVRQSCTSDCSTCGGCH